MRWVLSRRSRQEVSRFFEGPALLAFDLDGTLAPIVSDPRRVRIPARTRRLLAGLAETHPCAVISGRSCADLRAMVNGTGIPHLVGNHGAEPSPHAAEIRRQVAQWKAALSANLPGMPGLVVEDKRLSLTVHYRHCAHKQQALEAILDAARPLAHARAVPGKESVSLVHRDAPDKGDALRALQRRLGCDRALFVGDDSTDEDVFALGGYPGLLTVRAGWSGASRAQYFLRGQYEIDALLAFCAHVSQPLHSALTVL